MVKTPLPNSRREFEIRASENLPAGVARFRPNGLLILPFSVLFHIVPEGPQTNAEPFSGSFGCPQNAAGLDPDKANSLFPLVDDFEILELSWRELVYGQGSQSPLGDFYHGRRLAGKMIDLLG